MIPKVISEAEAREMLDGGFVHVSEVLLRPPRRRSTDKNPCRHPTTIDVFGQRYSVLWHPDDMEQNIKDLKKALILKSIYLGETKVV